MKGSVRCARLTAAVLVALVTALSVVPASAVIAAEEAFLNTWSRTDKPVADGQVNRTWMWGPQPNTTVLSEEYDEHPTGQRPVQYWDKSRMEVTDPNADSNSIWYVTNGLLVRELTSGEMQMGNNRFVDVGPARVNVAGDADDPSGPTYQTIGANIDSGTTFDEGQVINGVIDRDGINTTLPSETYGTLATYGVTAGPYSPETQKHTASVFWEFMTSKALVYENGTTVTASLFENPYYATGLPIDQAWWANVEVADTAQWVLIQCFERRCLTYTPGNNPGWQVEAGNVGQHYYQWRYGDSTAPEPPPPPPSDPTPPTEPTPDPGDAATFGDGIWMVGEDIQPGIYRNLDTASFCYWARLSGLGDETENIIANGITDTHQIVEIDAGDLAFESSGCGTWSSDLTPITTSPTADFGSGSYFVGTEVAAGLWRNSDSSDGCYWERVSGFGGSIIDDVISNSFSEARQVVEIAPSDAGFTSRDCGTWTYNPGPVTSSLTGDIGDGTYIVGVDIQAGTWQTDATIESCYWERLSGFGGSIIDDVIDNEFIGEDDASSQPHTVTIANSDAGFLTEGCGTWSYVGS